MSLQNWRLNSLSLWRNLSVQHVSDEAWACIWYLQLRNLPDRLTSRYGVTQSLNCASRSRISRTVKRWSSPLLLQRSKNPAELICRSEIMKYLSCSSPHIAADLPYVKISAPRRNSRFINSAWREDVEYCLNKSLRRKQRRLVQNLKHWWNRSMNIA